MPRKLLLTCVFTILLLIRSNLHAQLNLYTHEQDGSKITLNDSTLKDYTAFEKDTLGKKFIVVGIAADFRGGLKGWTAYLEKNLNSDLGVKYIKLKKKDTLVIQSVIVSFIVDRNGQISEVTAEKNGTHPKLIEEAIRVVAASPRWKPAEMELFETTNGEVPLQKILDKKKTGFTKVIYRHKQSISFSVTP